MTGLILSIKGHKTSNLRSLLIKWSQSIFIFQSSDSYLVLSYLITTVRWMTKCGLPLREEHRFEQRRVLSVAVGEEEYSSTIVKAAKCFLCCLTPSSSNSSCTELPLPPPLHYGKLSKSFSWSLLFASGIIFDFKGHTIVPKQTNEFNFTTMIPQVNLFLFVFWKKSKAPKNCFKMNWALIDKKQISDSSELQSLTLAKTELC